MAEASQFDLVVIGGGPAGYVSAIRGAQLGMRVACIDKRERFGGTCLNVGCIPSKAMLESSEQYDKALHHLADHGVECGEVKLNLETMLARKNKVVDESTKGVDYLFKKNDVAKYVGSARLVDAGTVEVQPGDGGEATRLSAQHVLIASGSEATPLPGTPFDGERIVSSTEALEFTEVPEHLIVVGGGVIGLEMGSVWRRLGAKVTVIEMLPKLLGTLDGKSAQQVQRILAKQGMTFHLSTKVTGVETNGKQVHVTAETSKGEALELQGDRLLVAIGRRPYTEGLGLEDVGVKLDDRGRIEVDAECRTSVQGVYAVGDVVAGPMLAHKASEEGVATVERIAGKAGHVNYEAIPWVVYTWPEIAWVGRGEEELKEAGISYNVGSYPFSAAPRARTMGEKDGMVKFLADARTDRLLGIIIVGPWASEMIAEAAIAMEFGASAEDIARSSHAHPTLAEAMKEAALGVDKRAIHI